MERRDFLFLSSGAAVGSLLVPSVALSDHHLPSSSSSGLATGALKPLGYKQIPGFLSEKQIAIHHEAHYGGALRAFGSAESKLEENYRSGRKLDSTAFRELERLLAGRGNSVLLHELYFDGMAANTAPTPSPLRKAIEARFGSVDNWAKDFLECAKAAAGWAVLAVHPTNGRLYNLVSDEHAEGPMWLAQPLVVIDTYEHAFYIDYDNRKAEYAQKFLGHMNWTEANRRFTGMG